MRGDAGHGKDWLIGGFLDSRTNILDSYGVDTPIIGDPMNYLPQPDDVFVCAMGNPYDRHRYALPILKKAGDSFPSVPTSAWAGVCISARAAFLA